MTTFLSENDRSGPQDITARVVILGAYIHSFLPSFVDNSDNISNVGVDCQSNKCIILFKSFTKICLACTHMFNV